ncbi:acyl-coenzyme A diphosphatase NUDT19-like isoform X1 [Periplaneta americana]|uniref:acyl-coenzyme A diphosphatase NUDT19-like isoform X1 n=1 Tax=Periplaneta americana TaxID=6978 RepID=UPI0037E74E5F
MSKYWREASSVIITARISFPKTVTASGKHGFAACKVDSLNKNAVNTVEGISTEDQKSRTTNFKVLSLKRGSKDTFMPDSYVFPGGNVDISDSSKDWLELFDECGLGKSAFETITNTKTNKKINIFENDNKNEILKSISLRITGIRETFEECGILLCKNIHAHSKAPSKWASYVSGHEIQKWQKIVQNNSKEFINLCKHFNCYPDIWALQEWSNWLTPSSYAKRFNTIFFLVALDQMPPAFIDDFEMNELKWSTPEEVLDLCVKNKVILPPPQFYELARLNKFDNIEELTSFAAEHSSTESELWMPVRIKTSDGELTVFPGDDLYPDRPNYESSPPQKVDNSILDLRKQSNRLHRMEHSKECNTRLLITNLNSVGSHIVPLPVPS